MTKQSHEGVISLAITNTLAFSQLDGRCFLTLLSRCLADIQYFSLL